MTTTAWSNTTGMRALFGLALRQHLHGKRWLVMLLLFLLPAALALIVRATSRQVTPAEMEFVFVFMFIPQALLPLSALIYASGMILDEQEEQTITYLLIRPIPRSALYCLKLAATLLTTVILTTLFTALTYAAIYIGRSADGDNVLARCLQAAAIHSLSVVCYCCLFGMISMRTSRILLVGIIYIAIVEGLFANVPFGIRMITVIYYARIIAYRTMTFVITGPRGDQDMAADAWQLDVQNDPTLQAHPQLRTCLIILLSASVVFTIVAAYLCSRREFHVKTPEQN